MDHSISRRRFLATSAVGVAGSLLAVSASAVPVAAVNVTPVVFAAAQAADVPRNRSLIMAGLGGEDVGGFTDVNNFNSFQPGISRSGWYQAGQEGLFYYNMLGDQFIPWLATGYQYNADYTGLTVTIRDGVEWADGQPFTANDVVYTLQLLHDNTDLNPNASDINRLVSSVSAPDPQTVQINLTAPSPRFHWDYLTFRADVGVPIVPQHIWQGQDPHSFTNYDPSKNWPVGTGPYKLVSTDVQQKIWDVRPDYWGAKTGFAPLPQVPRLIFLPGMNEITMAQMLIANQIDMAFSLTSANLKLVQGQNQNIVTHYDHPPYGYMDWWPIGLGFNTTVPPFDDPQIRWAMSYAMDRDEQIAYAFGGYSQTAAIPFPPYPGLQQYWDGIADQLQQYPTLKYDQSQVDQIMGGKGYSRNGDGLWADASGQTVSFQIITFPQHPSCTPLAPIVTQQLKKAGFDASFLLPADFVDRITSGQATAFLWGHGGSMRDPYKTSDLYNIRYVKPTGTPIYFTNIYRWSNQPFSDLVDQMAKLPNSDPGIMPLWQQAMQTWLPELPDIPLAQTVINVPMNTTYWTNWPLGDNPYIHEGFWHRTALLMFEHLTPTQ
ncbi:MAG: ABC transporter substrate-binding protein [Chloroflexi bacterium]|nr:ABC transporter substrate-binding protein [Chloroflexota bacterium]